MTSSQVLNLLQYFPNNPFIFVLYGCLESDRRARAGAFLKALKLDRNFTFAIDQLAFLLLSEKKII